MIDRTQTQIAKRRATECVVLLSGGIDSAACAHFLLQQFEVRALHITYGQPAERQEQMAAAAIAEHYGIPLSFIQLNGSASKTAGEIAGRNAFLLFTALMEVTSPETIVALGIHSGSTYYDCSMSFIQSAQAIVDGYCDGRVRVLAPFADWTKGDIWDYCLTHTVPVELTYSCEQGLDKPCGKCRSCRDLEALRVRQKLDYPA